MLRLMLVAVLLCVPAAVSAQVVVADDFERYSAGDTDCATFTGLGPWTFCEEHENPANPCNLSVATIIPGYAGAMPSGAKVLHLQADARQLQTDCTLRTAGNDNSHVPPSVWLHSAVYIRSAGTTLTARPMKFWYPVRGPSYPCTAGSNDCSWMLQLTRNAYAPFDEDGDGQPTPAGFGPRDLMPVQRDGTAEMISWNGTGALGQTSHSDWLRSDRWNTLTFHMDSSTNTCHYRAWVGRVGGALTPIMDWRGGDIIEGRPFTCDLSVSGTGGMGHRQLSFLTTIPANNTTGTVLDMYFDDVVVAGREQELPAYARPGGGGPVLPSAPRNLRIRAADSLALLLIPVWWLRRRGTA